MQQMEKTKKGLDFIPAKPTFITTPTGLVVIWGYEHVSKKMLEVLGVILSHDAFETVYHGIKSVVFRIDGHPKENKKKSVCASFAPDTGGMAINMDRTFEKAVERSMNHPETSLLTSWWIEMLLNFGHETHHGTRWETNRKDLFNNKKALTEEENRAEKYSNDLVEILVKEYDIEVPLVEEEVWFNNRIIELIDKKKSAWAKSQKYMLANKILWRHESDDGEDIEIYTFKDFMCLASKGDAMSEEWNKPTIKIVSETISLDEQLNGKKVTIDHTGEKVPETVAQVALTNLDIGTDEGAEEYEEEAESPVQTPQVQPQFNFNSTLQQQPVQSDAFATAGRIAQSVYMKMYNFIFTNCNPIKNSDTGFSNPEAVLSTPIPLTAEEASIVVSMNHNDINGRWCPGVSTTNGLLGKVMKNTKLPSYEVNLSINGVIYKRLFIPQNPAKRNNQTGLLTQRAMEARAGNAIAYIIAQDDNSNNKWGPYIINGEYHLPKAK